MMTGLDRFGKELYVPTKKIFLTVPGVPIPQGSKRTFGGAVVDANYKTRPWRIEVSHEVRRVARELDPEENAFPWPDIVMVYLTFYLKRPKYHYNSKGQLKPKYGYATPHGKKPDIDKLARCILDAMSGIVYIDYGQVQTLHLVKFYSETCGVDITCQTYQEKGKLIEIL